MFDVKMGYIDTQENMFGSGYLLHDKGVCDYLIEHSDNGKGTGDDINTRFLRYFINQCNQSPSRLEEYLHNMLNTEGVPEGEYKAYEHTLSMIRMEDAYKQFRHDAMIAFEDHGITVNKDGEGFRRYKLFAVVSSDRKASLTRGHSSHDGYIPMIVNATYIAARVLGIPTKKGCIQISTDFNPHDICYSLSMNLYHYPSLLHPTNV